MDNFADYYSEQKKLEAKELKYVFGYSDFIRLYVSGQDAELSILPDAKYKKYRISGPNR